MNQTLIGELEKLNDRYPFRVFELETLDGRRIRVTQRFRKLWGEEGKDGDIRIENGVIALLRYNELKDVIYFLPAWKQPFSWLYNHPEWFVAVGAAALFGVILGISLETCSINTARSQATTQQKAGK